MIRVKFTLPYVLSSIRRRPRSFLAMTAVSASIMTILIMMLLYMNASWRAEVMPDNEHNYHFRLCNLTEQLKNYIRNEPWVQATYDHYTYSPVDDSLLYNDFRVRVTWDEVLYSSKHAKELLDKFDLWSTPYYEPLIEAGYNKQLAQIMEDNVLVSPNDRIKTGETASEAALRAAKQIFVMSHYCKNQSFCRKTINSYIIRPEFFNLMSLIALFLSAAIVILQTENYHHRSREFGSLRTLGMKKRHIVYICSIESLLTSLAAIPFGTIAALIFVKLYIALFGDLMERNDVYMTLLDNIPISVIVFVSILLTLFSLLACIFVAVTNRNRDIVDLIRGQIDLTVSFVAKTSGRFENAKNALIYSSMYTKRTKKNFILSLIIVIIMLPLPLGFTLLTSELIFRNNSGAIPLESIYYGFQTLMLMITSASVIFTSTKSSTDRRRHEIGVFRSLGLRRSPIRQIIARPLVWKIILAGVPATIILYSLSNLMVRDFGRFVLLTLLYALVSMLIITPPIFAAMGASLRRTFKMSAVEDLRDFD